MAIISMLFGFAAFVAIVDGDIDCQTQNSCDNGNYQCSGTGCMIECTGQDSCEDSSFTCDSSCTADCSSQEACEDATFYFGGGDVTLDCSSQEACESARVIASNDTVLTIACDGQESCESLFVECQDTSTFSISCDGDESCESFKCTCETSGCETSGSYECSDALTQSKHQKNGGRGGHGRGKQTLPHFKPSKLLKKAKFFH